MTPALATAELTGVGALAAALGVEAPAVWPPEFYEADDVERMGRLLEDPANAGWALYYLILRTAPRALAGVAGFAGRPSADGVVEIGYAVLPAHRRLGLASEAVAALLALAFAEPLVGRVVAETYPSLDGSIGVLVRNRFSPSPARGRGDTLRYELSRSSYEGSEVQQTSAT